LNDATPSFVSLADVSFAESGDQTSGYVTDLDEYSPSSELQASQWTGTTPSFPSSQLQASQWTGTKPVSVATAEVGLALKAVLDGISKRRFLTNLKNHSPSSERQWINTTPSSVSTPGGSVAESSNPTAIFVPEPDEHSPSSELQASQQTDKTPPPSVSRARVSLARVSKARVSKARGSQARGSQARGSRAPGIQVPSSRTGNVVGLGASSNPILQLVTDQCANAPSSKKGKSGAEDFGELGFGVTPARIQRATLRVAEKGDVQPFFDLSLECLPVHALQSLLNVLMDVIEPPNPSQQHKKPKKRRNAWCPKSIDTRVDRSLPVWWPKNITRDSLQSHSISHCVLIGTAILNYATESAELAERLKEHGPVIRYLREQFDAHANKANDCSRRPEPGRLCQARKLRITNHIDQIFDVAEARWDHLHRGCKCYSFLSKCVQWLTLTYLSGPDKKVEVVMFKEFHLFKYRRLPGRLNSATGQAQPSPFETSMPTYERVKKRRLDDDDDDDANDTQQSEKSAKQLRTNPEPPSLLPKETPQLPSQKTPRPRRSGRVPCPKKDSLGEPLKSHPAGTRASRQAVRHSLLAAKEGLAKTSSWDFSLFVLLVQSFGYCFGTWFNWTHDCSLFGYCHEWGSVDPRHRGQSTEPMMLAFRLLSWMRISWSTAWWAGSHAFSVIVMNEDLWIRGTVG
jgi:hypothetical protein